MELAGRTVVVTGAASGIGSSLALEAAERGARVAAVDVTSSHETVDAIRAAGGNAAAFRCDITDWAEVQDLATGVEAHFGLVHALAANAGLAQQGSIDATTYPDFERVLKTNVLGTFACVQAFLPLLRQAASAQDSDGATVLITGSEHSLGVPPNQHALAYTTSKHALLGLADVLRGDLADSRISVTLLCPGWTLTSKVLRYMEVDPEAGRLIRALTQTPQTVARFGWDAARSGTFLAVPNPATRDHATRRIEETVAALERLQAPDGSSTVMALG